MGNSQNMVFSGSYFFCLFHFFFTFFSLSRFLHRGAPARTPITPAPIVPLDS